MSPLTRAIRRITAAYPVIRNQPLRLAAVVLIATMLTAVGLDFGTPGTEAWVKSDWYPGVLGDLFFTATVLGAIVGFLLRPLVQPVVRPFSPLRGLVPLVPQSPVCQLVEAHPTPGSGKTFHVLMQICARLSEGLPVIVLSYGRAYRRLLEELGGRYVLLQADGNYSVAAYGNPDLLTVYDFEPLGQTPWTEPLPELPKLPADGHSLVVIDSVEELDAILPARKSYTETWVSQGASFCVVGPTERGTQFYRDLPMSTLTMRLSGR